MLSGDNYYTQMLCYVSASGRKIYNGSSSAAVDNVICNTVEVFCRFMLLCGDNYDSLTKCMEASEKRHSALKYTGLRFMNDDARDGCMEELISRNHKKISMNQQLLAWKNVVIEGLEYHVIDAGHNFLTEALRALVHVKIPRAKHEKFRREEKNIY